MKKLIVILILFPLLLVQISCKTMEKEEFFKAVKNGDIKTVKTFIDKNPEFVNIKSIRGSTPLHMAALKGHTEIVKLLVYKGAYVNAKDKYGKTPLDYSENWGFKEIIEFLRSHGAK